jgi:hypothetical protein
MKITQFYFIAIAALMWMSYTIHHDEYKQKQQEAQVHRQFCVAYTFHPDCSDKK